MSVVSAPSPPDPLVYLFNVPKVVEPNEEFTIEIWLENPTYAGDSYFGSGAHINIDNGDMLSVNKAGFDSYVNGVDGTYGREYVEFYRGPIDSGTTALAYVTIKAPSSGSMNIQYRGWMRDSGHYLYRDPDDPNYPDGTTTNAGAKDFMDWETNTKTVAVATPLTDDTSMSVDLSYGPRRFSFNVPSTRWAVAGIRLTDGDDHDIKVDDDRLFGSPTYSGKPGTIPDFVVVNGHNNYGDYYAEVYYSTGSGHSATIEAEGSSTDRITVGSDWYFSMGSNEVNEMYEVYLDSSKTYTITLDVTSGSADLDLFAFDSSNTIANRNGADDSSTSGGGGQDEVITGFSPSETGYTGIAVVHDGTGSDSASYTLTVSENSPPSASDNDYTPSSGDTNTYFDFYMTYTDSDNDPPPLGYLSRNSLNYSVL